MIDRVFEREAKKLLRRMINKNSVLRKSVCGTEFGLWINKFKKPSAKITKEFLEKLQSFSFVEKQQENWVLSDVGRSFLRRQLAPLDKYRCQHLDIITKKNHLGEVYEINMNENPLFWLRKRKGTDGKYIISEAQMRAGLRLQQDFFLATNKPKMTIDLTQVRTSNSHKSFEGAPMSEMAIDARLRMQKAIKLLGPGLADIALEVCCYMQGLERAERHLGWPKRAGKVVLQIALARLALLYRMK